jgi:hypothetical protein
MMGYERVWAVDDLVITLNDGRATDAAATTRGGLLGRFLTKTWKSEWLRIVLGIWIAGTINILLLGAIILAIELCTQIANILDGGSFVDAVASVFDAFIWAVIYAAPVALLGSLWTGGALAAAFPIVYLVVRTIGLRVEPIWLGAFTGGFTAAMAFAPFLSIVREVNFGDEIKEFSWLLAIGPGLATIVGQIGGAMGGWWSGWSARRSALAGKDGEEAPDQCGSADSSEGKTLRYRISHLLWIAVWLSAALSVIRLTGLPIGPVLAFIVGWFFYQALTLAIGWAIVTQLRKKWMRRQGRST